MVVVPVPTPVSTPLDAPMVATDVFGLIHTPGDEALVSVIVLPSHTSPGPIMGAGMGFTVTGNILKQPEPMV